MTIDYEWTYVEFWSLGDIYLKAKLFDHGWFVVAYRVEFMYWKENKKTEAE